MAQRTGLTVSEIQKKIFLLTDAMTSSLQEGNALLVPGFGTFEVRKKNERVIVNPASGQRQLVPPKLVLGFKPVPGLKNKVK